MTRTVRAAQLSGEYSPAVGSRQSAVGSRQSLCEIVAGTEGSVDDGNAGAEPTRIDRVAKHQRVFLDLYRGKRGGVRHGVGH